MEVSIIIPTYEREEDLREVLYSILRQTKLPKEVVIVDDSEGNKTRDLIKRFRKDFLAKGIALEYLSKRREIRENLAASKNVGVTHVKGEITFFLDDDIVLDEDYIKEILKVYERYSDALGVQGYIKKRLPINHLFNCTCKIFYLDHFEKDKCKLLPSDKTVYPLLPPNGVIKTQWLSGTASYRSHILKKYKFDEKLRKYSLGEDKDFSYRISKHYSGAFYMTPYAKAFHKGSPTIGLKSKSKVYIETIYPVYLFCKNRNLTMREKIIFIWSLLGQLAIGTIINIVKKGSVQHLIGSYAYTISHFKEVKNGIFSFLDTST